jgi:hypothetical protein
VGAELGTASDGGLASSAPSQGSPGFGSSSAPPSSFGRSELSRKRDRLLGLVIVAVAFALCLALSFWAKEKSEPETSEPPGPPTVTGIVGYPKEVDAIETLKAARGVTKRKALRGIVLEGVNSSGALDLSEPTARGRFVFQSEPGEGPQPPREPGTLPRRVTCGKQNVVLRNGGMVAEPDQADHPCPPGGVETLPEPQCNPRALWKLARRRHIPSESVARIEYFRSKAGPAWRFEVPGTVHRFTMYGDCKRELNGPEAQGSVP